MSGTGIRSNLNTDRGSVFGGLLYSEISITGPRYPDLLDIRTKICPYIETRWPPNGYRLRDNDSIYGHILVRISNFFIKLDRFGMNKIFLMTLFFIKRSSLAESGYRKFGNRLNCNFDNRTCPVIKI